MLGGKLDDVKWTQVFLVAVVLNLTQSTMTTMMWTLKGQIDRQQPTAQIPSPQQIDWSQGRAAHHAPSHSDKTERNEKMQGWKDRALILIEKQPPFYIFFKENSNMTTRDFMIPGEEGGTFCWVDSDFFGSHRLLQPLQFSSPH